MLNTCLLETNHNVKFLHWEILDNISLKLTRSHCVQLEVNYTETGSIKLLDGRWTHFSRVAGNSVSLTRTPLFLPSKLRNRRMKAYNGNRMNVLKLSHWNAGNSKWETKIIEIEALVLERKPDILFITEANMWSSLVDSQRDIVGYQLYFPQAMMDRHNYARIVLLAKDGIDIKIHNKLMHEDLSVIWISLCYLGNKRMKIRGIYESTGYSFSPNPTLLRHTGPNYRDGMLFWRGGNWPPRTLCAQS